MNTHSIVMVGEVDCCDYVSTTIIIPNIFCVFVGLLPSCWRALECTITSVLISEAFFPLVLLQNSKEKSPQNYIELKTSRIILTDRNKASFRR